MYNHVYIIYAYVKILGQAPCDYLFELPTRACD